MFSGSQRFKKKKAWPRNTFYISDSITDPASYTHIKARTVPWLRDPRAALWGQRVMLGLKLTTLQREQLLHPSWLISPGWLLPVRPENESRWWTRVRVPLGVTLTLLWDRENASFCLEDILFILMIENGASETEHGGKKQMGAFRLNLVTVWTCV